MDDDDPWRLWHEALICLYLALAMFGIGAAIVFVWSVLT
jgi:hypothetical protein